jgi:hypothetical protein
MQLSIDRKNSSGLFQLFLVDRILYEPIAGEYDNPRAAIAK